jgi:hypothetical protein
VLVTACDSPLRSESKLARLLSRACNVEIRHDPFAAQAQRRTALSMMIRQHFDGCRIEPGFTRPQHEKIVAADIRSIDV